MKMIFKSMSTDGNKISVNDLRKVINDLNIKEEVAAASEIIERTSGVSKAQNCTMDQFSEVLRGKPMKKEVKVEK
jgi:hypothetical protein